MMHVAYVHMYLRIHVPTYLVKQTSYKLHARLDDWILRAQSPKPQATIHVPLPIGPSVIGFHTRPH